MLIEKSGLIYPIHEKLFDYAGMSFPVSYMALILFINTGLGPYNA